MINSLFLRTWIRNAALFVSCFFVFACENDPNAIKALSQKLKMVDEGKKIEAFLSQGGKMRAKLIAPVLLRYEADTQFIEFPKNLHVNFFDSLGKIESQVDAHYGKYFESQSKVFLKDSVLVCNVKGDTLRTSELWWDQNAQRFYTDKQVRIKTKSDRIYGGLGLDASQDLSDVTIRQPTGIVGNPDAVKSVDTSTKK